TIERGVICPFFTSASRTLYFMPGAEGLRDCSTYHGPSRARVAWRVRGEFSIVQRAQAPSPDSATAPQNGQTVLPRNVSCTWRAGDDSSWKLWKSLGESMVRLMVLPRFLAVLP